MNLDSFGGHLTKRNNVLTFVGTKDDIIVVDRDYLTTLPVDGDFIADMKLVPAVKTSHNTGHHVFACQAVPNRKSSGNTCEYDGNIILHKLRLQLSLTQCDENDVEQDKVENNTSNQVSGANA